MVTPPPPSPVVAIVPPVAAIGSPVVATGSQVETEVVPSTTSKIPISNHGSSFVSVVQNKQILKKYEFEVPIQEGERSVEVPDEVFENACPLWEDFLVGQFLSTAPHVGKVHVIVNKIWNHGDKSQRIDVYEVNETTVKFRVSNPILRSRILKRGMWNIAEIPMVVSKWSPITEDTTPEVKSIPMWVHLKNVPMNMFSWKGLSFIASAVGDPVRLHPETTSCSSFEIAKVFVNADLSKELPKTVKFTTQGKATVVQFTFPWLPPRCNICEKWGHLEKVCGKNSVTVEVVEEEGNRNEAEKGVEKQLVVHSNQRVQIGKENIERDLEADTSHIFIPTSEVSEESFAVPCVNAPECTTKSVSLVGNVNGSNRYIALDFLESIDDTSDEEEDHDKLDQMTPSGQRLLRERPVRPSIKVAEMQSCSKTGGRGNRGRGNRGGRG